MNGETPATPGTAATFGITSRHSEKSFEYFNKRACELVPRILCLSRHHHRRRPLAPLPGLQLRETRAILDPARDAEQSADDRGHRDQRRAGGHGESAKAHSAPQRLVVGLGAEAGRELNSRDDQSDGDQEQDRPSVQPQMGARDSPFVAEAQVEVAAGADQHSDRRAPHRQQPRADRRRERPDHQLAGRSKKAIVRKRRRLQLAQGEEGEDAEER
ncbi:MAG: hypothetical protein E6J88_12240 [Deltaproteobacteria bacterium]|nr:MAG: hypothetical protein E6J88_12240 [Deltaproteobacteria bacterium]